MALAIQGPLRIKHADKLGLLLLALIITSMAPAYAEDGRGELIFISGYDVNLTPAELEHVDRSGMDGQVSFLDLPLWIKVAYISGSIMDFIAKNPGCIISHIIKKENIPKGTARYHLKKLGSEGKIILKRMGKTLRMFISSRALSDKEKTVAAYVSNEKDRTILYTILKCEGSTNQYLSDKLHMSKSVMHKYLKKYEGSGIVRFKFEGRNKKYFLEIEVKDILAKYKNSPKA